jgi:class 3 adenylate cyclase
VDELACPFCARANIVPCVCERSRGSVSLRPPGVMTDPSSRRKLAAILSADAVGYSSLMAADEAATVESLKAYRDI